MTQGLFPTDFINEYQKLQERVTTLERALAHSAVGRGPDAPGIEIGRPIPEPSNLGMLWVVEGTTTRQLTISSGTDWLPVAPSIAT